MKTLPQIVSDMRANAQFLMELAGDIEQVANFFGGAVTQPVALPTPSASIPAAQVAPTPPKKIGGTQGRKLTKEEKEAVRADWVAIPKHLRTANNRAALLLKHQITGQQFHALTREDGHMQRIAHLAYKATHAS